MSEVHKLFPDIEATTEAIGTQMNDSEVADLARYYGARMPDRRRMIAAVLFSTVSNDEAASLISRIAIGIVPDTEQPQDNLRSRTFTTDQKLIG